MKAVLNGQQQKKVTSLPRAPSISEKLYKAMIENSYDVVTLLDKEAKYLFISASVKRILGYEYKELIGRSGFDFIHPDDQSRAKKLLKELLKKPKSRVSIELRFLHKNNNWSWLEASATNMLHDPSINAIICNFHDVTSRKRSEENLATSEVMLRLITDAVPVLISYVDKQERYRFNNKSYEKWFGVSKENIYGKHMKETIGEDAYKTIKPYVKKALQGQPVTYETMIQYKNKSPKYIIACYVPHLGADKNVLGYYAVVQDLTDLKLTEIKMKENEERYKRIIETTGIIPWESDYDTGIFTYVGPQAEKILGYPIKEWYKKTFWQDHIHPQDKKWVIDYCMGSSKKKKNYHFEYRMIDIKGHYVWLRDVVSVVTGKEGKKMLRGFMVDITAYKIAEEALIESENKFRTMAESAPVMIWTTRADGYCTYMNKRWRDVTGQSQEEALGEGWLKMVHLDDVKKIRINFISALTKRKSFNLTYRIRTKDGTYRWMMDSGSPTFDAARKIIAYIGTVIDIHDRIELEHRKDEFMSVASHELKTPVTSLKAYTQLLKRTHQSTGDAFTVDALHKMDNQIDKLTHLIVDLLDVSKIEAGKLQFRKKKISIYPLLKETIENVQTTTDDHSITLHGSTRAYIAADADRIAQIIVNLLGNAIKYSPNANAVDVTLHRKNSYIIISVHDYGVGMNKVQQERVFDRFYQVSTAHPSGKAYSGLGIGLYISQELAKRHGGEIIVESKPGKGSIFNLILPVWGRKVKITSPAHS